jgi:hypothetical protein
MAPNRSTRIPTGRLVCVTGQCRQHSSPSRPAAGAAGNRWAAHLLASMAATLGALLLVALTLLSADNRDGKQFIADRGPFQTPEPAAADGAWDVPLLAMMAAREAIPSASAAPQSVEVLSQLDPANPELGPLPREVVRQADGPPIMPALFTAAVVLDLAASRSALAARPDEALPRKDAGRCQANGGCGGVGTRVAFEPTAPDAFAKARNENKLVFVIHLAGNLEDPGFT